MHWLDKVPLSVILIIAIFLALAPFIPEPHLWQKLKMLMAGDLVKPLDMFDLVWHGGPLAILVLKMMRVSSLKKSQ